MSNFPPRYKDAGKNLNGLLFRDFDATGAVKIESKSAGVKFNADWEQKQDDIKGNFAVEVTGKTPAATETTVSVGADTFGARRATATLKGLVAGLDVTGGARFGEKGKADAVLVGARYRREYVDGEFSVDALPQEGSAHELEAAATVGFEGFYAGAKSVLAVTPQSHEVETDSADGKKTSIVKDDVVSGYDFVAGYTHKDFEVNLTAEKKCKQFTAGFLHHFQPNVDVAAHVKKAKGQDVVLTIGAAIKDGDSTLKVKVDNKGELAGSFSAPFKRGAVVTIVGKVSTVDTTSRAVGLQLALK